MSLDFSLVRKMRENLNKLLEYLVDKEIQDTPWKAHVEKQLFDIGQEILLLLDELEKYTEFKISDSFQPYDFFHYLLLHFETLEAKIGAIPPLVLQELRDWFDLFNQFEAKLSTFLEPLRSQTCWEEDEELAAMRRARGRRGRKPTQKSKFAKKEQLFAQWGGKWLPVTIVDVLPNKYYNIYWPKFDEISSVRENELKRQTPAKTAKSAKTVKPTQKSKFAKKEQLFAQWGGKWLPVTIVDVLPNKYYNIYWTKSDEISSVHEDELKRQTPAKTVKRRSIVKGMSTTAPMTNGRFSSFKQPTNWYTNQQNRG